MKKTQQKTAGFFKRNAMYIILALCILAIGLATTFMLVKQSQESSLNVDDLPTINDPINPDQPVVDPSNPTDPDEPVVDPSNPTDPDEPVVDPSNPTDPDEPVEQPLTFLMPVAEATSIIEYSDTLVFNSTLNRFSVHYAVDFFAPEGTTVCAVADGKVVNVENSILTGITVTIDHGEGLYSIYNSLSDVELIENGTTVYKGQKIGEVSTTNRQEYKAGAHLHFEMKEGDLLIDPAKYLDFIEK